jgi:hypothetical protein
MIDCSSCRALRLASGCSCLSLAMRLSRFLCANPPTRTPSICPGAHMGNALIAPLGSCPWDQISRQAKPPGPPVTRHTSSTNATSSSATELAKFPGRTRDSPWGAPVPRKVPHSLGFAHTKAKSLQCPGGRACLFFETSRRPADVRCKYWPSGRIAFAQPATRPAVWWEVGQVGFSPVADPPPYSRLLGFWVPVVGPLNPLSSPLEAGLPHLLLFPQLAK